VVAVSDGQQAMEFLDRHPNVDLVLCDVVLAGEHSGLDVARHLAETGHGARILLMSGYAEPEIERQVPLQDAVQLLHKPFHRRQLEERVAEVLSQTGMSDRRRASW
jgi:two-component system cell cycle sensor histidine kinase/response regulator CckA